MNESRKQRPNAPRLDLDTTIGSSSASEGAEELEGDDSSEDEGNYRAVIFQPY